MVTACTLGAIVGSCVVNSLLTRFGRVGTLRLGSWVFLVSSILSGFSPNYLALGEAAGSVVSCLMLFYTITNTTFSSLRPSPFRSASLLV